MAKDYRPSLSVIVYPLLLRYPYASKVEQIYPRTLKNKIKT